ncbi:NAD(P)H-dependent oxidoreductase [Spiractinospora alimapuensis]|uniref:NADPH-dependent FMN reductase n=1 Tax=Spiractinospora alimapuensis TaxID=2820884 RepID=UPI001F43524B|nr:NADPH-dependent FMN reductase [Spiractinospora alimapuensis]QVQ52580.1 NAD(P)H-dependent oxidoreductase [Spiractinospora alimapuensis]
MNTTPPKIAIIIGTTRPDATDTVRGVPRKGKAVGDWVEATAKTREDATYTLIDLADVRLPLFDEPLPPLMGTHVHPHTRDWAATTDAFDGFVFVTAEYNRSVPAALKNALDYLYAEWGDKAAAIVSYGALGGTNAADHLRAVLSELGVAHVPEQVTLGLYTDFEGLIDLAPQSHQPDRLHAMLDHLTAWTLALRPLRAA